MDLVEVGLSRNQGGTIAWIPISPLFENLVIFSHLDLVLLFSSLLQMLVDFRVFPISLW